MTLAMNESARPDTIVGVGLKPAKMNAPVCSRTRPTRAQVLVMPQQRPTHTAMNAHVLATVDAMSFVHPVTLYNAVARAVSSSSMIAWPNSLTYVKATGDVSLFRRIIVYVSTMPKHDARLIQTINIWRGGGAAQ